MRRTNPRSLEHQQKWPAGKRRAGGWRCVAALVKLLLLLVCALPIPSYGQVGEKEQQREPLGSLSGVGEVYLNGSPAQGESTIFPGDRIRTGETGAATFVASGKGTLKTSAQSQLVFWGKYEFTAELEAGTVVLNTTSGPQGLTLRIGNYVLVPSVRDQSVTAKVTRVSDGSFLVSSLEGSVGVLTLDSKSGQFLPAGQTLTVAAKTGLLTLSPAPKGPRSNVHSGWLLLGLAGAGAAVAAAELGHGAGGQSISPSTP